MPTKKTTPRALPEPKSAATRKKRPPPADDPMDTEVGGDSLPARNTRRLSTENRKTAELQAILDAHDGKPLFAFPAGLPKEHQKYWVEIVNSKPFDYFNNGDLPLLKLYCRAAHDIERHDAMLQTEGEVIYNTKGNLVVNPRVLVRSIAETRLLSLATKLRAQPTARMSSDNDKAQSEKKKNANSAARSLQGDEEDLLAGGSSARGRLQ